LGQTAGQDGKVQILVNFADVVVQSLSPLGFSAVVHRPRITSS
jgi:hypothetical protein